MSRDLSPDDLMHGAMYAMEQGGHLLRDAVAMYTSSRYASSMVLGVFAREEIGRATILLEMRKNAIATGSAVSVKAVAEACDDHVTKLTRGRGGITFEWGPERSADLKGLWADPQSEEFKKAHAFVDDLVARKARRDPDDTHQKRMRALYVEPTDTGWNRPCETAKEDARRLLRDTANAYGIRHGNLYVDEALAKALAEWKECPTLPHPISGPELTGRQRLHETAGVLLRFDCSTWGRKMQREAPWANTVGARGGARNASSCRRQFAIESGAAGITC